MRVFILIATIVTFVAVFALYEKHNVPLSKMETKSQVRQHQLKNGMKVLVVEDHQAPIVVSQIWYRVGGSYEHSGITGVSHVLEHMMFKGTRNHAAGEFSRIIKVNGGRENAFTGKDYTAYFQRIASDRFELCLSLEADRMRNLLLNDDDFIKEVEVVKEERRMRTDDDPNALLYERFNSIAFDSNPYSQPIIGWMEDLDSMRIEDLRSWYNMWYGPNNATLVVVGDVKADDVFKLTEKYFDSYSPSEIPLSKPRKEVQQYGIKKLSMKIPARVPSMFMGYKVPSLNTSEDKSEAYALEVLAGILDGGYSARLSEKLIREKQIATSIGASYDLYSKHDNLFVISAVPADDKTVKELEAEIKKEIDNLKEKLADSSELNRVIAQVVASSVFEQDSSFYRAMQIGILETAGLGWEVKDEYVNRIRAVTAEEVQKVASKYLVDNRLTVAVLEPQSLGKNGQKNLMDNKGAGDAN